MATYFLDPNGNNNTLWATYDYTGIDDAIRQPSTGFIGSILASEIDDNENQAYNMSMFTLPAGYQVTDVNYWAYGSMTNVGGNGSPYGDINWAGCSPKDLTVGLGDAAAWHNISWTGLTVTSQAVINGTIMYIDSKACPTSKGPLKSFLCLYLEITTALIPVVGPEDLAKWNGLDIVTGVEKLNGILWSDLEEWNGIS